MKEVIEGEDGVCGLWRGLKVSLVLVVNLFIIYGVYERLKEILFVGKKNFFFMEVFGKFENMIFFDVGYF